MGIREDVGVKAKDFHVLETQWTEVHTSLCRALQIWTSAATSFSKLTQVGSADGHSGGSTYARAEEALSITHEHTASLRGLLDKLEANVEACRALGRGPGRTSAATHMSTMIEKNDSGASVVGVIDGLMERYWMLCAEFEAVEVVVQSLSYDTSDDLARRLLLAVEMRPCIDEERVEELHTAAAAMLSTP